MMEPRDLNDERAELPDIDVDLAPSKLPGIMKAIRERKGQMGISKIATFGTEGTRSAIKTACRGYRSEMYPEGIDVDTSSYLTSLIPEERGFLWKMQDVIYGDKEKGRKPVKTFLNEVSKFPGLVEIIEGIEGLINKRSSHASGVIFYGEDPYETACFMKTPAGEMITQYDLHDAEYVGDTKYDFLVTEIQDEIIIAIQLLQQAGEIEPELSLREAYDKYLHPSVLPLDDDRMWKALEEGTVLKCFQFDSPVGAQAASLLKPKSPLEMADANSLMRLMAPDKDSEQPMVKAAKFKDDISLWYEEMENAGLTIEQEEILEPHYLPSFGVPPQQEQLMQILMDENICGFGLADANNARKIVGKKLMDKIPELRQQMFEACGDPNFATYVWDSAIKPQLG